MLPTIILKVLKAEGMECDPSQLGCYIHHNDILQDIITPLAPDHSVCLPSEGYLKITLKSMSEDSTTIGTVVFSQDIVHKERFWLPLSGEEPLTYIPDIPESPMIQISIENCEHSCELSPESNIITVSDEENDWPRLRLQLKMQNFTIQELSSELQNTKEKLSLENDSKQQVEDKHQETLKEYSQFVSQAQEREKSMLRLLEQKDLEIAENINQALKLQGYLDRLLEDKRHLEEKLTCFKTVAANDETEILKQQVYNLKTQLAHEDKRRQEMQEMLLQIGKEWRENEDQEKLNIENKLLKAEQEILRGKVAVQELTLEVEKGNNTIDKLSYEILATKQELDRTNQEKAECESEINELKTQYEGFKNRISELEGEIVINNLSVQEGTECIESLTSSITILEKSLLESQKACDELAEFLNEEKKLTIKLTEKYQQEKLYTERLNEQIIHERISNEKIRDDFRGPGIEVLIDNIYKTLKLENPVLKVGDSYFLNGEEVFLERKTEYLVEVKTEAGNVPFIEFISCPRTPAQKKKNSQDSKTENEVESMSSCFSIDKDKSMFNADKMEKVEKSDKTDKKEQKQKTVRVLGKVIGKLPLKDRNGRQGSLSVERKRPFK